MDIISLEEKCCKYYKKLRWWYNEVEVVFNIHDLKIVVSLYYDKELDLEKKEKRNLDLFAKKSQICKNDWKTECQIVIRNLQFNYSDVLFGRENRYVSLFEFNRQWTFTETVLYTDSNTDRQFKNNKSQGTFRIFV